MSAAHKTTDQLKRPAILVTLTAGELKRLRVIAAKMDMPVKHLAEHIVSEWIQTPKDLKTAPEYAVSHKLKYNDDELEGLLD